MLETQKLWPVSRPRQTRSAEGLPALQCNWETYGRKNGSVRRPARTACLTSSANSPLGLREWTSHRR